MTSTRVLVTGGSGFIAGHCILQALEAGYQVRTTVRSLDREASARSVLTEAGMTRGDDLSFVAADLLSDDGWAEAAEGVDYLLHVASPVAPGHVENEDDVIIPAREGSVRAVRAAIDAGVKRVVLTSAFHAVSWGHPHDDHVFTEEDWTVLDGPGVDAYGKSKTLAEQDAWALVAERGGSTELTTLLPVAVMGPVMGHAISGANGIVQRMLTGAMPALPRLFIPIVDVRDVARAHLSAMTAEGAAGERLLLSNGPAMEMKDIAATIREAVGAAAGSVPTEVLPDDVVRQAAEHDPALAALVPDLGWAKQTSNAKAGRVLGWTARDPREAITSAAETMLSKGLASTR